MNQREAKRRVCADAAVIIRAALNRNQCGDMTDAGGPDEERLTKAYEDLILELVRRGER